MESLVSDKPAPSLLRLVILLMLVGSIACITYGAWLMATAKGAPLAIFIVGALLGAVASVLAGRLRKK
jgi:hypothetical protein